jgi:N-acetylmuramoyl-L-alanine amidase
VFKTLKPVEILFGALIFLAGCATAPTPPPEIISPKPASGETSSLNWTAPGFEQKISAPARKTNPGGVRPNLPPATLPKIAPAPVVTWTALKRWAAERKIGAPHLLSRTPVTAYAVSSASGTMVVAIGSHDAAWNGMEISLGFEPQFIDGEVFLHGLDLEKNLEPLLCEPPISFPSTNRVIVIDPGHGGANTGTRSVLDGRFEKEFTLDWAKRLAPLLESNGWTVFLTRTNDSDVSLSNRVAFAEAHHADLFVSLHFNSAAPETRQAGLETYCLTPAGMPSTLTRGYADLWSETFPNNRFDAQNLQLAARLHYALLRANGEDDRGIRRARFMGVLVGQKRPAVLIEGGYLSNPREAAKIEDAEFRQKLAAAVAAALK